MGLLTTLRKFRYPQSSDVFNPPLHFKQLADDVDGWTGNNVVPIVNDAADRDAKFPVPSQGMGVWRLDAMWEERYFAAVSVSNPGGVAVAGWYPVAGSLPAFRIEGTKAAQTFAASVWTQATSLWADSPRVNRGMNGWGSSALTIKQAGLYLVSIELVHTTVGATRLGVQVTKNSTNPDIGLVTKTMMWSQNAAVAIDDAVPLAAGDVLRAFGTATGTAVVSDTTPTNRFTVRYVGPA